MLFIAGFGISGQQSALFLLGHLELAVKLGHLVLHFAAGHAGESGDARNLAIHSTHSH